DHQRQLFDVGENQVGAFIGGEAARKSDSERVRAKHAAEPLQHVGRLAAALGLLHGPASHELEQPLLEGSMCLPKLAVVDAFDAFPDPRFAAVLVPSVPEVAIV